MMRSNNALAAISRRLFRSCCTFALLLVVGALSLAPLSAQASVAARPDRLENCNWNRPGVNPFMGDVVAAVDRYTDIPVHVRERLKQRMRDRTFDEFVTISRDSISGNSNYEAKISDMHFGDGRVCRQVSRAGWNEQMKERGLVYCEEGQCILVPTICRNVSRITRRPQELAAPMAAAGPAAPASELRSGSMAGEAPPTAAASDGFSMPGPVYTAGFTTGIAGGASVFSGSPGGGSTTNKPEPFTPLNPVPEPETWSMLLAGLALVAVAARRSRKAKA